MSNEGLIDNARHFAKNHTEYGTASFAYMVTTLANALEACRRDTLLEAADHLESKTTGGRPLTPQGRAMLYASRAIARDLRDLAGDGS